MGAAGCAFCCAPPRRHECARDWRLIHFRNMKQRCHARGGLRCLAAGRPPLPPAAADRRCGRWSVRRSQRYSLSAAICYTGVPGGRACARPGAGACVDRPSDRADRGGSRRRSPSTNSAGRQRDHRVQPDCRGGADAAVPARAGYRCVRRCAVRTIRRRLEHVVRGECVSRSRAGGLDHQARTARTAAAEIWSQAVWRLGGGAVLGRRRPSTGDARSDRRPTGPRRAEKGATVRAGSGTVRCAEGFGGSW
jgi:hypothetical protein